MPQQARALAAPWWAHLDVASGVALAQGHHAEQAAELGSPLVLLLPLPWLPCLLLLGWWLGWWLVCPLLFRPLHRVLQHQVQKGHEVLWLVALPGRDVAILFCYRVAEDLFSLQLCHHLATVQGMSVCWQLTPCLC